MCASNSKLCVRASSRSSMFTSLNRRAFRRGGVSRLRAFGGTAADPYCCDLPLVPRRSDSMNSWSFSSVTNWAAASWVIFSSNS